MTEPYHFYQDLAAEIPATPEDSILSRSMFNESKVKVTLFRFSPGQELTEHTAASPAILHFLEGDADLTLGPDAKTVQAGSWVYMPARLPHSLTARTPLTMLLLLLVE
ncbi:MAG TPA: cupin domain-containing protein [Anaerolineaceae bacterium]